MKRLFLVALLSCAVSPLSAQLADGGGVTLKISDATPVHLVLMDNLQDRRIKVGDQIHFQVREDVVVARQIAIKTGSVAIGHVTRISKSGLFGKSGNIGFRIDSVPAVNGVELHLKGSSGASGGKGGALTWESAMWFGPDASIPIGTMMNAFIDGDQTIALVAATR